MNADSVQILDPAAVRSKLLRMAYEIYEAHYGQTHIVMIGIGERGGFITELLQEHLEQISNIEVEVIHATLDRGEDDPLLGIDIEIGELEELAGKDLVVVDDVLYSGMTMLNVVAILLQARPRTIQTVVLIDRGHRTMPVAADITGMQLATTLQQHVSVRVFPESRQAEAYLS